MSKTKIVKAPAEPKPAKLGHLCIAPKPGALAVIAACGAYVLTGRTTPDVNLVACKTCRARATTTT